MTRPLPSSLRLACLAVLGAAVAAGAQAESFASSASSAGSASVGSLSDSSQGSSDSSQRDHAAAAGDYRIVEVAPLTEQPALMRLTLQPLAGPADTGTLWLNLPRQTWERQGLGQGDVVGARKRPYGLEFARADTREAFYLLLADDWRRELDPRAVPL